MSGRKINALERKLHQAALARPNKVISQKDLDSLVSDTKARVSAVNFLLSTGLFVLLVGDKDTLSYRAVSQDEIELKKGLSQEETMVLDRIRAAATEGIWTKYIKVKTQLHQTIVDKCLRSLTQKRLIKTVNDVRYATRKIYMSAELEPSPEMTGGPWFTDRELDTEFIKLLSDVCLKIIRDKSLPKPARDRAEQVRLLYPPSYSSYPNAEQILALLKRSRVTETELTVQQVEMLLNVLILDGKVAKIPAFVLFDQCDAFENSDSDTGKHSTGKRRRKARARDTDESTSTDSEDSQPRKKRRRRRDAALATSDEDVPNANDRNRQQRKKRRRDETDSDACDTADSDASLSGDDEIRRKRRRRDQKRVGRSKQDGRSKGKRKGRAYSASSDADDFPGSARALADSGVPDTRVDVGYSSGFVYQAIHEERIRVVSGLGQAPCVGCPTADFCTVGGPVNPQECVYYETWLDGDVVP
ncbi:hypothetical protein EVJ58_g6403 [Rhodofomes roseus]|uniref:DNA-directed RNA polymerase III subunit RPC6 n=1 Tax=Rhodofomes roseus TaxID=34475 RepID=A0A4Y9Y9P3_9APHY|nr:hypothetical protein EVJ58_g6403 [Rhodofomes roseus]